MVGVLVEEELVDHAFLAAHARRRARAGARGAARGARSPRACARAGSTRRWCGATARVIGGARAFASFEDLGVQMNRALDAGELPAQAADRARPGTSASPGTHFIPTTLVDHRAAATSKRTEPGRRRARSSAGSCRATSIADEILTDHPKRYRAMLVEAANPAHSLADSQAHARGARRARHAGRDRRRDDRDRAARALRAAGVDAVREGRGDVLQLRVPEERLPPARAGCSPPPPGTLPEAEIHARLVRGARRAHRGRSRAAARRPRRRAAPRTRTAFMARVHAPTRGSAGSRRCMLYRTLDLPDDAARGRGACSGSRCAPRWQRRPSLARAGFGGTPLEAARRAVRRDPREPVGRRVRRRRVGRRARARSRRRTARSTSRSPSCSTSSRALPRRRGAAADPEFPFVLVGRRAPLVHREHDHPRPGVAQEGRRRRAAHQPRRRGRARRRDRRRRCG